MGWLLSGLLPPTWINPAIECKSGGSTKIYIFVGFPSIFPSNKANDLTTLHPSDHPNAYLLNFHVESAIWRFDRILGAPKSSMLPCYIVCFFSITNHQFWSTSILRNFHIYIYMICTLYPAVLRKMGHGFWFFSRKAGKGSEQWVRSCTVQQLEIYRLRKMLGCNRWEARRDFTKCGSNKFKHPKWWDNVDRKG